MKLDILMKSDKTSVWSLIVAFISVLVSVFAITQSYKALKYTKEINKAAISVIRTDKKFQIKDNKLLANFSFVLENTGNEPLFITGKQTFLLNRETDTLFVSKKFKILNPVNPGVTFVQKATQKFKKTNQDIALTKSLILPKQIYF